MGSTFVFKCKTFSLHSLSFGEILFTLLFDFCTCSEHNIFLVLQNESHANKIMSVGIFIQTLKLGNLEFFMLKM